MEGPNINELAHEITKVPNNSVTIETKIVSLSAWMHATVVVNNNTISTTLLIYDCEFLLIQLCPKNQYEGHTHTHTQLCKHAMATP